MVRKVGGRYFSVVFFCKVMSYRSKNSELM